MAEKLGGGGRRKKADLKVVPPVGAPGGPANAAPGHNSNDKAAKEEAARVQLLSAVHKIRAKRVEVAAAKVIFDARKAEERELFKMADQAGFKRNELTPLLDDLEVTGSRKDLQRSEERRIQFRKWLNLPTGEGAEQRDLLPEETKDEMDWRGAGYAAGFRADERKPPQGMPKRFDQAWLESYDQGRTAQTEAVGKEMQARLDARNPPPAAPEPPKEPTKAELAAQTARAKESLEKLGTAGADTKAGEPGDDFEASADELAKQVLRPQHEDEAV